MATRNPSTGMAHLTVVPENFDPTADDEATPGDGVDERADGGESPEAGESSDSGRARRE